MAADASVVQRVGKRKPSAAGFDSGDRSVKRRASKACHCCRARKVRCDVVENGLPCTNCRLDEVECTVSESKKRRRRKPSGDNEDLDGSPISSPDNSEESPLFPSVEDIDGFQSFLTSPGRLLAPPASSTLEFELSHHVPHMLYQTQGLTREERRRRMSLISQSKTPLVTPMNRAPSMHYYPHKPTIAQPMLPPYIRALPPRIVAEDVKYLQRKGALTIPDTNLRNELLRNYVQFVHPFMPVLELADFLTPVERNDGNDPISLLLFQAVMFAGTAYVDMRLLQALGYESRKIARKAFFQRVRMLYDFDYESDRISLVQALLLMTSWYDTPDDLKDTWYWMGVTISLAQTMGLHKSPKNSILDPRRQKRWKRIWWSCYMRDRLIGLGMRRPTRIRREDFDVPTLEQDDFDTEPLPHQILGMLGGCPSVGDAAQRRTLALLCIELSHLCLRISHILSVQYSSQTHRSGGTTETTMMLVPKLPAARIDDVRECDQELDRWLQESPVETQYFIRGSNDRLNSNDGEVISVHRALLRMLYYTASSALHRPQVLPSAPGMKISSETQAISRRKVRDAANEITEVARHLYVQDQVRYLPSTSITVLIPALIVHLLDIKSRDPAIRAASTCRFYQCMQVLQRLREMYASADSAIAYLEAAIRKANIDMQYQPSQPSTQPGSERRKSSSTYQGNNQLTPPPDVLRVARHLLYASTLAPDERSMFNSLSPPESDRSLNDVMTGGAAITLDEPDATAKVEEAEKSNANTSQNEFDALINFEGGQEFFVADDGMGIDLDMDWLAGMPRSTEELAESLPDPRLSGESKLEYAITGDLDTDLGL